MKQSFLSKLLTRLDSLDSEELQTYLERLARENGFLEAIFNTLQEGVMVVDNEARIIYLNHSVQRLVGLGEEALGQNVSQYISELNWEDLLSQGGVVTRDIEVFYPEARYLQFYLVPLSDSVNSPQHGVALIFRDMTILREKTAEAIESERVNAITLLAAGVAHELGNPLNSLHIHLQLIKRGLNKLDGDGTDKLRESVEVAQDEVSRLDTIIQQFLGAVRPGKVDRKLSVINDLVQGTLEFLGPEIRDRDIIVEEELTNDLPPLPLDATQIKQALFNLIKNALHAMEQGGILRLQTARNETHVVVAITDSGKGIPAEMVSRVFEPYVTTKEKGTGLGLYIVQRIVRDHGGELMVESREGQGTTVRLILPIGDRRVRLLTVDSS